MPFKGDLTTTSFADLLHKISTEQKEGTLVFSEGINQKHIYIGSGKVTLLSTGKRQSLKLGELLINLGKINEDQLQKTLAKQKQTGEKTGKILLSSKMVTQEDVDDAIRIQIYEEIFDIITWDNATFEFDEGPIPVELAASYNQAHSTNLDFEQLMSNCAKRLEEWHKLISVIQTAKSVYGFEMGETPLLPDGTEHALLTIINLIDGRRSIDDIIKESGLHKYDVFKHVYHLLEVKLLTHLGVKESSAAETARIAKQEKEKIQVNHKIAELMEDLAKTTNSAKQISIYKQILELDPARISIRISLDKLTKQRNFYHRRLVKRIIVASVTLVFVGSVAFGVKIELDARKAFKKVLSDSAALEASDDMNRAKNLFITFKNEHRFSIIGFEAEKKAKEIDDKIASRQTVAEMNHKQEIENIKTSFEKVLNGEGGYTFEKLLDLYSTIAQEAKDKDAIQLYYDIINRRQKIEESLIEAKRIYQSAYDFEAAGEYERALQNYIILLNNYAKASFVPGIMFPVVVNSTPSKASVWINDKPMAETPYLLRYPPGSSFKITVDKSSFKPMTAYLDSQKFFTNPSSITGIINANLEKSTSWVFATEGYVVGTPAEVGTAILVPSRDGAVYLIDQATGNLIWKKFTDSKLDVESSPVIYQNTAIFGCNDGNLYCLDLNTVEFKWRTATGGLIKHAPVIGNGGVYVTSSNSKMLCINPDTGQKTWEAQLDSTPVGAPVVLQNVVFSSCSNGLVSAIDAQTGNLFWETKGINGTLSSAPSVIGGVLYAGTLEGTLYAVNIANGGILWSFKVGGKIVSTPASYGNRIIIGTSEGKLRAINSTTKTEEWSVTLLGPIKSNGTVSDNFFFIGDEKGLIYAIDCDLAKITWKYATSSSIHSQPLVTKTRIFVGSNDKKTYSFEK